MSQKIIHVSGHRVQITYRPRLIKENMIVSLEVDGKPLDKELLDSYFLFVLAFLILIKIFFNY